MKSQTLISCFSILIYFVFTQIALSQIGQLDPTFGQDGIVSTVINTFDRDSRIRSTAIQDDGKIVAAGYFVEGSNSLFALARYNPDGTLDNSFGTNGRVITRIGNDINRNSRALGVSLQDDGKILAAGYSFSGGDNDFVIAKYNPNGDSDTTFGVDGIVMTPIGDSDDRAYSVTIQSDDKIVVGGYSDNGTDLDFAMVRYNPDGTVDTTFATNGIATTPIGTANDIAASVALQSDGKIVAAGYSYDEGNIDFALVRYNTDGMLDTAFGTGGMVTTPIGDLNDVAQSVAIQNDGKIIASGYSSNGNDNDFAIVRYNSDGTLDNSFGTGGVVITLIGNLNDRIQSTLIQGDGKLIAGGYSDNGSNTDVVIVRYNTDGELDNTFGTGGIVTTSIGLSNSVARSMALSGDGKIVAAGYSDNGEVDDFALVRYNTNGALDITFGTDGIVTTSIGGGYNYALSTALQDDGKIVAAGYSEPNEGNLDFSVIRYNKDGSLDNTFGENGIVTTSKGASNEVVESVVIQDDGKIVAAGYTENSTSGQFAMVRYNASGFIDKTFGANGIVITPIGLYNDVIYSLAIQSDGKIVAAGSSFDGSHNDMAVARYNPNGSLDTTFGTNGIVTTSIEDMRSTAYSMALQRDGKIVLTGFSDNGFDWDFAVMRYNQDGSLDNTFGTNGIVITPVGSSFDVARAVAIQSDDKIVAAGYANSDSSDDDIALVRYDSNGDLDNTFGTNGIVTTPMNNTNDYVYSAAIQNNGKIVAAGHSRNGTKVDITIIRYGSDGALDHTFGTNGITTTQVGASKSAAQSMTIQGDGNIVVAGFSGMPTFNFGAFVLARYMGDAPTGIREEDAIEIAAPFELEQNYPNPFNSTTNIGFQIVDAGYVSLKIYDILGNEIATLVDEEKPAGSYELSFDARGLSSGIYFYTLTTKSFAETKQFFLVK